MQFFRTIVAFLRIVPVNYAVDKYGDDAAEGFKNGKTPGEIKGGTSSFEEVNIHGKINTELDEVDLVNQIIYEDKSAGMLYM